MADIRRGVEVAKGGASVGGALGSVVVPVLGTVIGGVIGGAFGFLTGLFGGSKPATAEGVYKLLVSGVGGGVFNLLSGKLGEKVQPDKFKKVLPLLKANKELTILAIAVTQKLPIENPDIIQDAIINRYSDGQQKIKTVLAMGNFSDFINTIGGIASKGVDVVKDIKGGFDVISDASKRLNQQFAGGLGAKNQFVSTTDGGSSSGGGWIVLVLIVAAVVFLGKKLFS